jgi:hypothetical protein
MSVSRVRALVASVFLVLCFSGGLLHGCGGSGAKPAAPTPRCLRTSDCKAPLDCVQGYCVSQCTESRDCSSGQRCIKTAEGNSCQPPEKKTCLYTSECEVPLVCAVDMQCRNQCQMDVDCPKGQKCTALTKLCADPMRDPNYDPVMNEFKNLPDGGLGGGAGGGSGGGAGGGSGGNAPDGGGSGGSSPADGGPGADGPPALDGPAQVVDGVTVAPNASVRQGQINITITITKASGGLSDPTLFDLGGLMVRTQDPVTDTNLVLRVSVPHAAALGKRTLRFMAAGGVVTAPDVVEVTAITAGPMGVDTNAGSAGAPFRSLKQAISVADAGDTIRLLDGTYAVASGETWGYVVPNNLTIIGDSTAGTIINGAGATGSVNGFDASTGLTLKSLTVTHFYYGIDMKKPASTLTLQDVAIASNTYYAIYVETAAAGSTVNISGAAGLIDQPGQSAIYVYAAPMVTVNLTDGTLQGGSHVIQFTGNCSGSKLNVTGTTIKQLATNQAIHMSINTNTVGTAVTLNKAIITGNVSYTDAKGSMTITDGSITQKSGNGLDFNGAALSITGTAIKMLTPSHGIYFTGDQGTMSLTGVQIDGGGYGVYQYAPGSSAKVRRTSIMNTTYHSYYLYAGDLDLGTATEPGDNAIGNPASTSYYCLAIGRPTGAAGGNPVSCSSTAFGATGPNDGFVPTPGTVVDAAAGTVSVAPQRYQVTTGNRLMFY